jgi:hypothetical protein
MTADTMLERDPSVRQCNDGLFWCVHTQTCIEPDGNLAEPGHCFMKNREYYGTGVCQDWAASPSTGMDRNKQFSGFDFKLKNQLKERQKCVSFA